jgi:hypothetical protein
VRAGLNFTVGSALPGIVEDPIVQVFVKETRIPFMDPNSREALIRRREAATLTWRGPARADFVRFRALTRRTYVSAIVGGNSRVYQLMLSNR